MDYEDLINLLVWIKCNLLAFAERRGKFEQGSKYFFLLHALGYESECLFATIFIHKIWFVNQNVHLLQLRKDVLFTNILINLTNYFYEGRKKFWVRYC